MSGIVKPQVLTQIDWSNPMTEGLVGYWPMLEGSGGIVYDYSGNNNHGTLTNMAPATDWVRGPHGWALDQETDDSLRFGYPQIGDGAVCTIIARMNWRTTSSCFLCDFRTSALNGINIYHRDTPRFELWENNARALCYASTAGLINAWHTWAFVWAGNGIPASIYLDGVDVTIPAGTQVGMAAGDKFIWGCRHTSTLYASLQTDYIGVYNRALSADEVADPLCLLRPARRLYWATAGGGTAHTKTLTDTLGMPDIIARAMTRELADALNASGTTLKATSRTLSEALAAAAAITKNTGRTITDAMSLYDAITRGAGRLLTEQVSVNDPTIARDIARIYTETMGVADSHTRALARTITDAFGVADTATVTLLGTAATGLRDILVLVDTRDNLIIADLRDILKIDDTRDTLTLL